MELGEVLSRAKAIPALLALKAKQPMGVVELTNAIEGWAGSGTILARALEDAGLVSVVEKPGFAGKLAYEIRLSPLGEKVVAHLEKAVVAYDAAKKERE